MAINSTYEANKAGSTCPLSSLYYLDVYETHDLHLAILLSNAISIEILLSFQIATAGDRDNAGSVKAYGREPKTGLGRVFNYKLGCIATPGRKCMVCMQLLLKL